ncbi:glutaminase A [Kocuria sp.]|uniref:glutaminase A n=1 Tax=Kocuria sp. TaxID=1871328 RepID=UPI0026E108F7|nr:glutaminase A [Kocuria sp.]MDO5617952.1 glutaminase A [Kocuria sp.]
MPELHRSHPGSSSAENMFGPSPITKALQAVHDDLKDLNDGQPLQSIPALAAMDPHLFGIVIATADGHVYEAGDTRTQFSIQSISKAFTYGLAIEDNGLDYVDTKIDVEPSGDAFNEISLNPVTHLPANPMINAGAITSTWLVNDRSKEHDSAGRRERIRELYSRCAGRELNISQEVLEQESEHGNRNRALGWMLRSVGVIEEDPTQALEDYFAQCSVMVDARDLALMAATLAAGGLNPRTQDRVFAPETVERVLSVMNSCGMYDDAGAWFVRVGLPAKSGVGGGIIAVVPGQLAIATFSPPLDEHGNSVRGIEACRRISQNMDLHFARGPLPSRGAIRSISSLAQSPSLMRRDEASRAVLARACNNVAVIEVQGDLLFPGAEETVRTLRRVAETASAVVIDFSAVNQIGSFVPNMVDNAVVDIKARGTDVVAVAADTYVGDASDVRVFTTRDEALVYVEDQILASPQACDAVPETPLGTTPSESQILANSDLLRRTGLDYGRRIWKYSREIDLAEGVALPAELARPGSLYMVVRGTAHIMATAPDGTRRSIRGLRPGTVFGDPRDPGGDGASVLAEITGQRQMQLVAASDVVLHVLDNQAFARLENEDPRAALALWKALAWVEADDVLASLYEAIGWEPGDHWDELTDNALAEDGL